jgi:hypothetical protein
MNITKRIFTFAIFIIILQGCSMLSSPPPKITSLFPTITTINFTKTPNMTIVTQVINTPRVGYTDLPTIDPSIIPPELIEAGRYSDISPSEAIFLLNILKLSAKNRDPNLLLDYFLFPIHESGRCPGDIITTSNDFITRFPEIMSDSTRENILKVQISDILLGMDGMALEVNSKYDIWFVHYDNRILLTSFLGFVTYWDYWEDSDTGSIPRPTIDPSNVKFGEYIATPYYISKDGINHLDVSLEEWVIFKLTLTGTSISMGPYPGKNKIFSYQYETMEICPVLSNFVPGESSDYVIYNYAIGKLQFYGPKFIYKAYLLKNNQLSITMEGDNIDSIRDPKLLLLTLKRK